MATSDSEYPQIRFASQKTIWFASVRPNGKPHLVPVWFIWHDESVYVCTEPTSVKARNISSNNLVTLAIEDTTKPVICEGEARIVQSPWPNEVQHLFERKYNWDIRIEEQYTRLIEVTPLKWLAW